MKLFKKARFFLPANPDKPLLITGAWIHKVWQGPRIPSEKVPVSSLSREECTKRMHYWNRYALQNGLIEIVILSFLAADIFYYQNWPAIIATLGAAVFIGAHIFYAHRMEGLYRQTCQGLHRQSCGQQDSSQQTPETRR